MKKRIQKGIQLVKKNFFYLIISAGVLLFSFLTISQSSASNLQYRFPDAGEDYSKITFVEIPIDRKGQEFTVDYRARDIGRLGLRFGDDVDVEKVRFQLCILDEKGGKFSRNYVPDDLNSDSGG